MTLDPMKWAYKLRVCRAILVNDTYDVARRGVYLENGLIVLAFGEGMRWVSDKQYGGGRTISELADGTTIEVKSGDRLVWVVDGQRVEGRVSIDIAEDRK